MEEVTQLMHVFQMTTSTPPFLQLRLFFLGGSNFLKLFHAIELQEKTKYSKDENLGMPGRKESMYTYNLQVCVGHSCSWSHWCPEDLTTAEIFWILPAKLSVAYIMT